MPTSVLSTKIEIPTIQPDFIERPRLTKRLLTYRPLSLVIAPAGYGKTLLVAAALRSPESEEWKVNWVKLDEQDNKPQVFWTYLAAGFRKIEPTFNFSAEQITQCTAILEDLTVLNPLLNEIAKIPHRICLVLDDYYLISNNDVHRSLNYLLEYLPSNLRMVLISRRMPPISLARIRAQGRVTEIGAADLALTSPEETEYLSHILNLDVNNEKVRALRIASEGWITGLQLGGSALQENSNLQSNFPGTAADLANEIISDYLMEEVLAQYDSLVRDFLIKTSILSELSAPLCDALLDRQDSSTIINRIEEENLFITPVDMNRVCYRYLPIFATALRSYLQLQLPELVPELHNRAYTWLKANGYTRSAISHALDDGQAEAAAELVEAYTIESLGATNYSDVVSWIDQLPDSILADHPRLYAYHAFASTMLGQPTQYEIKYNLFETVLNNTVSSNLPAEEIQQMHWYAEVFQALYNTKYYDAPLGIAALENLVQSPPPNEAYFEETALAFLAEAQLQKGLVKEAQKTFLRACRINAGDNSSLSTLQRHIGLARAYKQGGQLKYAEQIYLQTVEMIQKNNFESDYSALPQIGLNNIALERGKPIPSETWIEFFTTHPDWFGTSNVIWEFQGLILLFLAKFLLTQHKLETAMVYFERVNQLFEIHQQPPAYWPVEYIDIQTRIRIASGNFKTAQNELKERIQILESTGGYPAQEYVSLARVLLMGGHPEKAIPYLDETEKHTRASGQGELLLETLILNALANYSVREKNTALIHIEKAIRMAEPQGYIHLFTELGQPLKVLLQHYLSEITRNQPTPHSARELFFLQNVIALFEHHAAHPISPPDGASTEALRFPEIEALSAREIEVLNLVLKRQSTKQIAAVLNISANTVKTHVRNIYQKYGVNSLNDLIEAARL